MVVYLCGSNLCEVWEYPFIPLLPLFENKFHNLRPLKNLFHSLLLEVLALQNFNRRF